MTKLTLAAANAIIAAAFEKAAELKLKPLGIVVLDAGGHPVAYQHQDGASFMRFEVASGKAYGALALGIGSRALAKMAVDRPHFFTGLSGVSGGRIVPVPGGVLIRAGTEIVGAAGCSGDTSDNDEAAVAHGIAAAGFAAEG